MSSRIYMHHRNISNNILYHSKTDSRYGYKAIKMDVTSVRLNCQGCCHGDTIWQPIRLQAELHCRLLCSNTDRWKITHEAGHLLLCHTWSAKLDRFPWQHSRECHDKPSEPLNVFDGVNHIHLCYWVGRASAGTSPIATINQA